MPISFEKLNPQAFTIYLGVMTDPTTPPELPIKTLVNMGALECKNRKVYSNDPDRPLPEGQTGYEWARNNTKYMNYYESYKNRGLIVQDKPFSLGMLNDSFSTIITTEKQMMTVVQSMNELNSLHVVPSVRMIKWISRFSFLPEVPKEDSFLRTIGYGALAPKEHWVKSPHGAEIVTPFTPRATDMAMIYATKEKEAIKDNLDTRWDSLELDYSFFLPLSAQKDKKKTPLTFSFPYMNHFLEKTIKSLNEKRLKRRLDYQVQFSGEEDAEYRDKLYTIIKEKKDEIQKKR